MTTTTRTFSAHAITADALPLLEAHHPRGGFDLFDLLDQMPDLTEAQGRGVLMALHEAGRIKRNKTGLWTLTKRRAKRTCAPAPPPKTAPAFERRTHPRAITPKAASRIYIAATRWGGESFAIKALWAVVVAREPGRAIKEASIKVIVLRMATTGLLASVSRGQYRITAEGHRVARGYALMHGLDDLPPLETA